MEHKFKIGDYVTCPLNKETFKVVGIAEGMKPYYGNWHGGTNCVVPPRDSYVVEDYNSKLLYICFVDESQWECVQQDNHPCCPRCKNELTQIESESILGTKYSGQKCSACGYCA
jgi:hypothetical protein